MSRLALISLIISIIGIFILLLIVQKFPVEVQGRVITLEENREFSTIYLDNNYSVSCENCKFKPGDLIKVYGKFSEYSKKRIIAEKIETISSP